MQLQGDVSGAFSQIGNLIEAEIPQQRTQLSDNVENLEKVAQYCEDIYTSAKDVDKQHLLNETKGYTTQALASVAYQIHVLANSFLSLLNSQSLIIDDMSVSMSHLAHEVNIHKEKVARREIGVLTTNKTTVRTAKVKKPEADEKPVKYVRKPIDYTLLDDIGHGVKLSRPYQGDALSKIGVGRQNSYSSTHSSSGVPSTIAGVNVGNGLSTVRSTASSSGSSYYRTPVAPPSVPSEYLSRQELGIYSSKKELNQSAGAESLSGGYGGPTGYRRQISNNSNQINNSMSEYSGTETLDRRMTQTYLQQLGYAMGVSGTVGPSFSMMNSGNNPNSSVGYASGKEIGLIRTNLNNIDYSSNGTMYRRPQLHNPSIYDRSLASVPQGPGNGSPVPTAAANDPNANLLRISAGLQQQNYAHQHFPRGPDPNANQRSNSGLNLPPPPMHFTSGHDDGPSGGAHKNNMLNESHPASMHNDDYSSEYMDRIVDEDDDIIPNWVS